MYTLNVIVAVLLGVAFVMFGVGKLADVKQMAEAREHLSLPPALFKAIGVLEVLGGAGVLIGLHQDLPLIGILAAIGLIGMTIGAARYHQMAGDSIQEWIPAVVMGSFAIFYIILRIASS